MDVVYGIICQNCDEECSISCNSHIKPEVCPFCESPDIELSGGLEDEDE
ncbi:hypothetical protein Kuja_0540 [Vibrio phage vB_VchM_Kuja]|uniref:Uncharacterized protein n=1 Tax=Vibrio phage vB_VchM_Kuja TaxID=2686437 RepID=A0A6B9J5E9_9CAUD|nr:hypothetical protein HWC83_gp182 [Vibrio phage vB_VchM_Kuja]QGZ16045.1 hypothetical protein Kuja_0540 [Vibrio phage vB_VchM_Kuja]